MAGLTTFQVPKDFFIDRVYARVIIEQEQQSFTFSGVLLDDFLHRLCQSLELCLLYESLNEDETNWLIGRSPDLQLELHEHVTSFEFIFSTTSPLNVRLYDQLHETFFSTFTM